LGESDWRRFYEQEAALYDRSRYGGRYGLVFQQLHQEEVAALLGPYPRGRALEVAAGTGQTTALIASMGFDLTSIDLTGAMLVRARERLGAQRLRARWSLGSAFSLPFADGTFPFVVSTRFLHLWPPPELRALLAEMTRVLAAGGILLLDFDNWWHRVALALPIRAYQLLPGKGRRVAEHYNRLGPTVAMAEECGLRVARVRGVGGYHLIVPALWSQRLALHLGRAHAVRPWRVLAEQFLLLAEKA
jgi:ubiquinone/menaquinone biosynthesis C-methylase UbiE